MTINQNGHVTADNIDTKLPDPTTTKPNSNESVLNWLSGALSPGSLNSNPNPGGGGQGSGTGSGTGSAGSGHSNDGTAVGSNGQATDSPIIDNPCIADPVDCQQAATERSPFRKLGSWKDTIWNLERFELWLR